MSVFVDTSALYAILDADDAGHARASQIWTALVNETETLVTSNYTLIESHALLQSRLGIARAFTLDPHFAEQGADVLP